MARNLSRPLALSFGAGWANVVVGNPPWVAFRHMSADLLQKPVTAVMTRAPKTIGADQLAAEAMNMMTRTPGRYLTSLVTVDGNGQLAGLIRLQDCLQAGIA